MLSSSKPSAVILPFGLHNFDYECPNAKFLVTTLDFVVGMGSILKNAIMPSIYMAFATGRIPLFIQSARGGGDTKGLPKVIQQPLLLTSCPRGDWQFTYLTVCANTG